MFGHALVHFSLFYALGMADCTLKCFASLRQSAGFQIVTINPNLRRCIYNLFLL